jgi:CO dehydrogenase/acetyl-CoA synthase beta subunit
MTKIWEWLKKNWKWVLFPVGILLSLLGWFLWWRAKLKDDVVSTTPDAVADQAVKDTVQAQEDKDKALKDLEHQHVQKLSEMTDEQCKEYNLIRKKSIEEVALWIDRL